MGTQKSPNLFRRGLAVEVKFFFLALLCLVLLVADSNWSFLNPVRTAISNVLYPVQRAVMSPRDFVSDIYTWSDAIKNANQEKADRQSEMIESARLRAEQSQLVSENNQLRRLLNVKESVDFPSVAVEILYTPPHPLNQTIVFTKGESEGIRPGMPVIAEGGVVGQIRRVNSNTSEAVLVTNEKISIPAMVQRNGLRVIAFGTDQPDRIEVRFLAPDADIKAGDVLVTSGIGGYYPAGLTIGEVVSVEPKSAQGFLLATAKPVAQPDRYKHFLVLLTDEHERNAIEQAKSLDDLPDPSLPLDDSAAAEPDGSEADEQQADAAQTGQPASPDGQGQTSAARQQGSNTNRSGPQAAGSATNRGAAARQGTTTNNSAGGR